MAWSEIQTVAQYLYGPYIGSGGFIGTTGSPTELAYLMQLVMNRITSYPHDFPFLKRTGTITLTGATSYDLRTLIPDFRSSWQMYGVNPNQEHPYLSNDVANITPAVGYTIKGTTITFTGNIASSGTATIQYKSMWMVLSSGGTRKLNFTDDSDTTVLDDADINVLLFGLGQFVNWKSDTQSKERRADINAWFNEAWTNLILHNENAHQQRTLL